MADSDAAGEGNANDRPELIVSSSGTLTVGRGVTFGTVDRDGARTPALGLRVETGARRR